MEERDGLGSMTLWLHRLKAGDPAAAGPLWEAYFARLVTLARRRLGSAPRVAADEEDVALSAFHSFCRAAQQGRFPRLDDRDDLWQVLFVITARKAAGLARHEGGTSGAGGAVVHASAVAPDDSGTGVLAAAPGAEPSPEEVAAVADECRRLLGLLGEGKLRDVAIWKMEGYTNAEIVPKLGLSLATVERKLLAIRTIWEREVGR